MLNSSLTSKFKRLSASDHTESNEQLESSLLLEKELLSSEEDELLSELDS